MPAKSKTKKPVVAVSEDVKRGNMFHVPFSKLRIVDGLNIRTVYEGIPELANSIRNNGIQVPVKGYRDVANDLYYVVHGHRRFTACELIYKEDKVDVMVPFIREEKGLSEEQRVVDMVLTNTGAPLNPLELGEAVRRLLNYGWDKKKIHEKLSMTVLYIDRLTKLNNAPEKFKKLVSSGKISGTLAIQIAGEGGVEEFMKDYSAGKFKKASSDEGEDKELEKITRKHLNKPDSVKDFKKFSAIVDFETMKPHQLAAFNFVNDLLANKLGRKEISNFFNQ